VAAAQDVNAVATAGFSDPEVAALLHALHRVVANLETDAGTG
jgi:hypothetical protein